MLRIVKKISNSFHIFPITHHTSKWQIMPFLPSPKFMVIFKGKKLHHVMGTISQGGNQMAQVSRDSPLWPCVWAAVIFHPFSVLLLTACLVKPEGIMPLCTLALPQTQTMELQLAPLYHPGVGITPSWAPSNSSSTFQCPQAYLPSWAPQSVEWSRPNFTEKQSKSLNMTQQNFPFLHSKMSLDLWSLFKGRKVHFLFKVQSSICALPGTLFHQ